MAYGLFYILLQAAFTNLVIGYCYALGTEISRRRELCHFSCGNESCKRLPYAEWMVNFGKSFSSVRDSLNLKWLSFIAMKSVIDILVYNLTFTSLLMEVFRLDAVLVDVSIALAPLHLISAYLVVGGEYDTDIAIGLANGVFHGYLELTAAYLDDCIAASRYSKELGRIAKRFILLPQNGVLIDSLQEIDDRITFVENTSAFKNDISGVKQRPYFQSVYKFTPRLHEFEEFYCIAEQSASIGPIFDLMQRGVLSKERMRNTVQMFHDVLQALVRKSNVTRGKFEIILFSGREDDVIDAVVRRRKQILDSL